MQTNNSMRPIYPKGNRRSADEVGEVRQGMMALLWVTGLIAVALLGSRVVSARRRKAEPRRDSVEYWYPYMQA